MASSRGGAAAAAQLAADAAPKVLGQVLVMPAGGDAEPSGHSVCVPCFKPVAAVGAAAARAGAKAGTRAQVAISATLEGTLQFLAVAPDGRVQPFAEVSAGWVKLPAGVHSPALTDTYSSTGAAGLLRAHLRKC